VDDLAELRAAEGSGGRSKRLPATMARRATMVAYLRMKVDEEDWHGVADAATDLREIEVELRELRKG
jgi:hypothetical protein